MLLLPSGKVSPSGPQHSLVSGVLLYESWVRLDLREVSPRSAQPFRSWPIVSPVLEEVLLSLDAEAVKVLHAQVEMRGCDEEEERVRTSQHGATMLVTPTPSRDV